MSLLSAWRRAARRRDFRRRCRFDSDYRTAKNGLGTYLLVHPLADDVDVLEKLGLEPTECRWVDAYWLYGGDVALLSVRTTEASKQSRGLFWGRASRYDKLRTLTLIANLDVEYIDRERFEQVMSDFVARSWTSLPDPPLTPQAL